MSVILSFGCTHAPFEHKDFFSFISAANKRFNPDVIVHLGDEVDAHAFSRYAHDPTGMGPLNEWKEAIKALKPYYKLFPKLHICRSNHSMRPFRKAVTSGIPESFLKDYTDLIKSPIGWKLAGHWEFDGVVFQHGEGYGGANGHINAAKDNMQSTVMAHLHSNFGVTAISTGNNPLIYATAAGCGLDRKSYAAAYATFFRRRQVLGAAVVINGIPTPIAMNTVVKGGVDRWDKRLLGVKS